jgi:hypothetical protein
MKFTPSKDGLPRATLRVDFRIGVDYLRTAAADIVWVKLIDSRVDEDEAQDLAPEFADGLTRREIVAQVRRSLRSEGYEGGGTDDDFWQIAYEATEDVVRRLWLEESRAWEAHARRK